MSIPHPLDQLIEEASAKLATAEREIARAERDAQDARVEISALEKAKALWLSQPPIRPAERPPPFHAGNGARRQRSLSDTWKHILRKMDERGESDLDQILGYSAEVGHEIERESLRAQMFNYVNRGLLERPRPGVFRVTPQGRKAAGIKPWPESEDAPTNTAEAS
jgi:hypothetical protein